MENYCYELKRNMLINTVLRKPNGDISITHYCQRQNDKNNKPRRITHDSCSQNSLRIFRNGEGYELKNIIQREYKYPNLIGCWCNQNLRFRDEEQLLNHIEGKTHPQEFEK